jgi:hypothetical protein
MGSRAYAATDPHNVHRLTFDNRIDPRLCLTHPSPTPPTPPPSPIPILIPSTTHRRAPSSPPHTPTVISVTRYLEYEVSITGPVR